MTQIKIFENQEQMTLRLDVEGHAGYAPMGCDVVCASVSILTQTLGQVAFGLRELGAEVAYQELEGAVHIMIRTDDTDEGRELFESASCSLRTVETGYRMIAMQYPDHVKVTACR